MSNPVLVVADTTPLNYLILIGQVHVLGALFGNVVCLKECLQSSNTLELLWR